MGKIQSVFTYALEDAGVNFDALFVVRIELNNGNLEWHYFGVTEADLPRITLEPNVPELFNAPFFEHGSVRFPSAFNDLPEESRNEIYAIAIPSGLNREGVW